MTCTDLQVEAAAQFLLADVRLPLLIDHSNPRLIVDADGKPVATVLPSGSALTDEFRAILLAMIPNVVAGLSDLSAVE